MWVLGKERMAICLTKAQRIQRTSVRKQVQQLLGYMLKEQVPHGVLYSDVGYWFFFDDVVEKVLKVSQCYPPMQVPPVMLTAAILYMGHLAVEASTGAGSQSPDIGGERAGGGAARDGGSGRSAGSSGMSSRASMGGVSGAGDGNSVGDEGSDGSGPSACLGPWTDCRATLFYPSASNATSPSAEVAQLLATTAVSAAAQQPSAHTAAGAAAEGAQAVAGAPPATRAQEGVLCSLRLGLMVSRDSYVARMPDNPNNPELFAVKVAQPCPDSKGSAASPGGAVRRLLHELDVYRCCAYRLARRIASSCGGPRHRQRCIACIGACEHKPVRAPIGAYCRYTVWCYRYRAELQVQGRAAACEHFS